ncbi:g1966 [Coccomyxa elongata]
MAIVLNAFELHSRRQRRIMAKLPESNEEDRRLPNDGGPGCGPDCLNRMLNMECVPGYCPCGERCSNQQFSKRQYAKLEKRRAGAKGFGLFATEDLLAGQFIIEYIGEVLEEEEYLRRKDFYQESGQRHYYFMNIGNGEVIDAARKGALGRFINHSCNPNCETQKWVVRGELAIGLYALKDIPAGVELTFDYNFERYGDKPMRCLCEAKVCRGFIGGTGEAVAQEQDLEDPADASEDPEPIMVSEVEAADPALVAILESEVGLASEFWDASVWQRLEELAVRKGLEVDWTAQVSRGVQRGTDDISTSSGDQGTETAVSLSRWRQDAGSAQSAMSRRHAGGRPGSAASQLKADRAEKLKQMVTARRGEAGALEVAPDIAMVPPRKRLAARADGSGFAPSEPRLKVSVPGRSLQRRPMQAWQPPTRFRRRSEVDRRLDELVGNSGRLKEASHDAVVRMLRLFNLCDVGPTITQADLSNGAPRAAVARSSAPASPAAATPDEAAPMQVDEQPAAKAEAADMLDQRRTSHADASPSKPPDIDGRASRPSSAGVKPEDSPERSDGTKATASATDTDGAPRVENGVGGAEEGSPAKAERLRQRDQEDSDEDSEGAGHRRRRERSPSRDRDSRDDDNARDREDGEIAREAPKPTSSASSELSARQRARMADLSLLLDVILKSHGPAAKKEFCECGVLHQLQAVHARCLGPQYSVILRKMLRVVEYLPFTPDHIHKASSAQGSFGDVLKQLCHHTDLEIRSRAAALLKKHPLSKCSTKVQAEAADAERSRSARAGRKRFGGRYTGGFWAADSNGRTPHRPNRFHDAGRMTSAGSGRHKPMRTPQIHRAEQLLLSPSFGAPPPFATPAPIGFMSPAHRMPPAENGHRDFVSPQPPPLLHFDGPFSPAADGAGSSLPSAVQSRPLHRLHNGSAAPPSSSSHPPASAPSWLGQSRKRSFTDLEPTNAQASLPPGIAANSTAGSNGAASPPAANTPVPPPLLESFGSLQPPLLELPLRPRSAADPAAGQARPSRWDAKAAPARDVPPGFAQPQPLPPPPPLLPDLYNAALQPPPMAAWSPAREAHPPAAAVNGGLERPSSAAWQERGEQVHDVLQRSNSGELVDLLRSGAAIPLSIWEETWAEPTQRFEDWVRECAMYSLREYCRPERASRISPEEAVWTYRKALRVVVDNERKAFAERQRANAPKPLDRRKLEPRIKEYIRETVRNLIEKRTAG